MSEENYTLVEQILAETTISDPEKNLRSKIGSILKSLEALQEKKLRIEFEIKQQKKSLVRKREELKRVSKRNTAKLKLSLEERNLPDLLIKEQLDRLRVNDQRLLMETYQALDK